MRREQDDMSLLWDMLDAAQKIQQFVAGKTFHDYSRDEVLQSAVERKLEIIGEAARNVSEKFQEEHPEIPWRGIISQRHFLAHERAISQNRLLAYRWSPATSRLRRRIVLPLFHRMP